MSQHSFADPRWERRAEFRQDADNEPDECPACGMPYPGSHFLGCPVPLMDRTGGELDRAVLAHRADPSETSHERVMAAMRAHNDAFMREQTGVFIEQTRRAA